MMEMLRLGAAACVFYYRADLAAVITSPGVFALMAIFLTVGRER